MGAVFFVYCFLGRIDCIPTNLYTVSQYGKEKKYHNILNL